ncbi:hypothetical protein E4U42_001330 [Claviceps africana]|uniref:Uncharacterized protein n=1 Tax=Claviceps africana TaxID=83212 RepID=A0A8K0J9L2_9HYPO|nr:hypothetical protein E4U42_001330 [Claviceps africana]
MAGMEALSCRVIRYLHGLCPLSASAERKNNSEQLLNIRAERRDEGGEETDQTRREREKGP